MKCISTILAGCFILEPRVLQDERGYFMESFNLQTFKDLIGEDINFVQDNESSSVRGVLRGLHYQTGKHAQAKLVRVVQGAVLDVVVDLRKDSATYGKHLAEVLSDENKRQLFIPRGFAHGFIVLSEKAIFSYKCDGFYEKSSEGGIKFDDPAIGIDWQLDNEQIIISAKDQELPLLKNSKPIW
jgi:dTDP-4-dehydrorhamnose 3,5-epimerase